MKVPNKYIVTKDDELAIDLGYEFDLKIGQAAIKFCEDYFRPIQGQNHFELLQWQSETLIRLLSWTRPRSRSNEYPKGIRRFLEGHIGIPRQNGKSYFVALLCYYMLIADNEPNAYIFLAGVNEDQTKKTIFTHIANSIYQTGMEELVQVKKGKGDVQIIYPETNSVIQCLTQTGSSKLGPSAHCVILEEFCFHESYDLFEKLKESPSARKQPLTLSISTSGTRRDTPAYERWMHARGIIKGLTSDINFFPLLYENDPEANKDIFSKEILKSCNPAFGETLNEDFILRKADLARKSLQEEITYRQWRLNEWVTTTNQAINLDSWRDCTTEKYPDFPKGTPIYLAGDLAVTTDLISGLGIIPYDDKYYLIHHSWGCWGGSMKADPHNKSKYEAFEKEGTLSMYEGDVIDPEGIREWFKEQGRHFKIQNIAFDPTKNALDSMLMLERDGFPCSRFIASNKNYNGPLRRVMELVLSKKIRHKGEGIINWEVQNLEAKHDGDLIYPVKPNDAMKRDLMICLILACDSMIQLETKKVGYRKIQYW